MEQRLTKKGLIGLIALGLVLVAAMGAMKFGW